MHVLVLGLYTEGSSDQSFLQPVIQRILAEVLARHSRGNTWDDVFIMPIKPATRPHEGQEQKILAAAIGARGCHLLIVHADADGPTSTDARQHRFDPGLQLVRQAGENVCQDLLPIIPIQEIEAWLLTDKERLDSIIRVANQSRRHLVSRKDLYEPLGEMVRLEKLASLPAYRQFISDLTNALIHLGIIPQVP